METPVQCSRVLILLQLPKNFQPRLLPDAVLCIVEVSGGTATFLPIHFFFLGLKQSHLLFFWKWVGHSSYTNNVHGNTFPLNMFYLQVFSWSFPLPLIFLPHLFFLNKSNHPLIHLFTQPTFFRRLLCSRYCDRC